jgi:ABC-type multidrug transport system fused ATPase/permease subunit
VSFAWQPDRPALDGVDLHVRGGEIVALVGPNGAGKSTLAALVNRLIVPDSGRVAIDGQDLRDVTAASLRRQVCVVAQEAFLFAGSIAENIRYARPDACDAELLAAARTARVTDFALGLPDGLDTEVGERGQRLSGGQVQRIALARAALVNPRILILDEATSAVDGESEAQIQEALFRLTAGRTVFVVAHRAATVRRADRVVVLDRGRVVEEGPHADLMRRRGFYARLFEEQILLRSALSA